MTHYERIEKAIRYIDEHQGEQPGLEELARAAGLSPSRFHRVFRLWAGTTPKGYLKFVTNARAKELLAGSRDLLGASLELGLSGPGRLHDLFVTVDAVTPGEFKAGGAGVTVRWGFGETPFGAALAGVTARGLCHLAFVTEGRPAALAELRRRWPKARLEEDRRAAAVTLGRAFSGGRVSLHLSGTRFQLKVWEALLRIPPGRAATYGQVAAAVGRPKAGRAVGTAVGANPLSFLIPCHRVLREGGALGGYRWGTVRKRAILSWEASRIP